VERLRAGGSRGDRCGRALFVPGGRARRIRSSKQIARVLPRRRGRSRHSPELSGISRMEKLWLRGRAGNGKFLAVGNGGLGREKLVSRKFHGAFSKGLCGRRLQRYRTPGTLALRSRSIPEEGDRFRVIAPCHANGRCDQRRFSPGVLQIARRSYPITRDVRTGGRQGTDEAHRYRKGIRLRSSSAPP